MKKKAQQKVLPVAPCVWRWKLKVKKSLSPANSQCPHAKKKGSTHNSTCKTYNGKTDQFDHVCTPAFHIFADMSLTHKKKMKKMGKLPRKFIHQNEKTKISTKIKKKINTLRSFFPQQKISENKSRDGLHQAKHDHKKEGGGWNDDEKKKERNTCLLIPALACVLHQLWKKYLFISNHYLIFRANDGWLRLVFPSLKS